MSLARRDVLGTLAAATTTAFAGCHRPPDTVALSLYNATEDALDVALTVTEADASAPAVDRSLSLAAADSHDVDLESGDYELRLTYDDVDVEREFQADGGSTFEARLARDDVEFVRSAP